MDVFTLEALVGELAGRLAGARIDKIHQPEPETIILRLWARGEEVRLLLAVPPGRARCHLTTSVFPNPPAPPRFCQLLRARLAGLSGFGQLPGERVIRMICRGREGEEYTLAVELFGAHPDLVLVDGAGVIVDALRRTVAGERENLPGRPYHSPAVPSRIALHEAATAIPQGAVVADDFGRWLRAAVAPMSPLVARDLAVGVARGESPAEVLEKFLERRSARESRPRVGFFEGRPVLLSSEPLYLSLESVRIFACVSEAADFYYGLAEWAEVGERGRLATVLRRQRQRLEIRLQRIAGEKAGLGGEGGQHFGDLLMANLQRLRRGMTGVTVEDLFRNPPEPIFIPLDPRLTPVENAEKFYKRQRKERKGLEHIERRVAETEEEIAWLDDAVLALEEAGSAHEVAAVRRELEEAGLVPPPPGPVPRRRPPLAGGVRQAVSPGGFVLFWGKTNYGNDRVSRQLTAPDYLWFHAHGMPGSHLVLQRQRRKGDVPEADILYAASIAAGYSRGKDAGKVEVMVTEGKHVRRPKGGRPGLVTVNHYRTVVVAPLRPSATIESA